MKSPLITQVREDEGLMRATALVVLVCFTGVFYSPALLAAYKGIDQWQGASQSADATMVNPSFEVFDDLADTVQDAGKLVSDLQTQVKEISTNDLPQDVLKKPSYVDTLWSRLNLFSQSRAKEQANTKAQNISETRGKLASVIKQLKALDPEVIVYFETQKESVKNTKQTEKNQARLLSQQQKQLQRYQRDMQTLQSQLQVLNDSEDANTLTQEITKTLALLDDLTPDVAPQIFDNFTPFGPLDATPRPPHETIEGLRSRLGLSAPTGDPEPDLPTTADLLATIDAPFSTDIQAKAAELNADPVMIYNWVYNNIRFIPSFGSIQGADQTLALGAGNATDTSSLLIALLRASNIEARYKYGTVRLPYEPVMNWVGGVKRVDAAQNLLSQGGIPNIQRLMAGVPQHFDIEHTWVQVWWNDQWVDLDASYKQYTFTDAMDLAQQVPFDAQTFVDTIEANSTINEAEGWVQGVDQAYIETQMDGYRQQLEDYLTNQLPNATVADVLGSQTIIETTATSLPTVLPYNEILVTENFSEVPVPIRHRFQFELLDQGDGVLLSFDQATVEIVGKKLALSFAPATAVDEQALLDYLPDNPQTPEELPDTIPANLYNVKGEFTVDGVTVAESSAMSFGQELKTKKGFWSERAGWESTVNPVITGEYQAVGVDLQGVSVKQLETLQAGLESTKTNLENETYSSLTKHSVVGDLLQAGVNSYMAVTNLQAQLMAQAQEMLYYREPSYGTLSTNASIIYSLGQPVSVRMTGILMDMDRMKSSTECQANCWNTWVDYNKAVGHMISAYEHIVPEQMFSTDEDPVEGVSAVKAISIATAQGQKVYTLTQDNIGSELDSVTVEAAIRDEIQQAVALGYMVTVHEVPISYAGWTGTGFIIVDPDSGAGAYKIGGGADGAASVLNDLGGALSIAGMISGGLNAVVGSGRIGTFVNLITFTKVAVTQMQYSSKCSTAQTAAFFITLTALFSLLVADTLTKIYNPLVAFATGLLVDQIVTFTMENIQECQ